MSDDFRRYRKFAIAELRPFDPLTDIVTHHSEHFRELPGVSISDDDIKNGSPKAGDMIARNPKNHSDQWLVAAQYFRDNYEPAE